jgi:hypothetical protein
MTSLSCNLNLGESAMNLVTRIATVALGLLSAALVQMPVGAQTHGGGEIWEARFVPCNPDICGGYPQNSATLSLAKGEIKVAQNGQVTLELEKLTFLTGKEVASNRTLDVIFGSFGIFQAVGTITTDSKGNFEGKISTGGGSPFAFPIGTTIAGQFVLNNPGVNSEFITGFSIP